MRLPIYYTSLPQEQNVCQPLTTHNNTLQTSINGGQPINLETITSIRSSAPLYDFFSVIEENCSVNRQRLDKTIPAFLVDSNNNFIQSNYNYLLIPEKTLVHVFKMNEQYQIEYIGLEQKEKYRPYSFEELYGENCQYTKDCYWINTLGFLELKNFVAQFYKIVNFKYVSEQEQERERDPKKQKEQEQELKIYKRFISDFLPQQQSPDGQMLTRITERDNIIKNITFMNMMEEFIALINLNYECNFTNKFVSFFNTNNTNQTSTNDLFNGFIIIMVRIINDRTTSRYVIPEITDTDKYNKFIEDKLKKKEHFTFFKLSLLELSSQGTLFITNLNFITFLYKKLQQYKETNDHINFLATIILLNKSNFFDGNNITKIKDAYGFINLANSLYRFSELEQLRRNFNKEINKNENAQFIDFLNQIHKFINDLNDVRKEFCDNGIGYCNEIVN